MRNHSWFIQSLQVDGSQSDPILCDDSLSIIGYAVNSASIVALGVLNIFNAINL